MDRDQVATMISEIAGFTRGSRGVTRLAFSDEDARVREYITVKMEEAGLTVRSDAFGNLIGRIEGCEAGLPAVATGSHLDTVPEGGRFDGIVGVVGGLTAIRRLLAERKPWRHPLELISFAAEESSRFGFGTMGSKIMAGTANLQAFAKAKDQEGVSFAEALAKQGFDGLIAARALKIIGEMRETV